MDEFGIIARYFAPLAIDPGALKLKDDAAFLPPRPGFDLVITTDQIAAETDFFPHDPPATVAKKALRVNLSDLAAKGARPEFYLLTLAMPRPVREAWLQDFVAGLAEDKDQFGISLLGGDTSATDGPLSISITAFGFVPAGRMVKRSGARIGDAVYVTGTIGDSAGGLAIFKREKHRLSEAQRDYLTKRYQVPEPPVGFGAQSLVGLASAAIDISDGLIADLGHVAQASRVRIELEAEAIPRSDALRALWGDGADAILRAATAGDDYQIAFTAPPGLSGPFTCIGRVKAGEGVVVTVGGKEIAVPKSGYRHF
ncbi:MAG TPA: thiamine-phosphate kinase [Rhizomicrobium sp.]|nr:thiamine-phosphate kinase [Rhizomicrobium sp.]